MPEETPNADIIMVATGTGIAPYRSFIRRLFVENTPARENFKGLAWLFLGVANSDSLLYDAEWQSVLAEYPENFRLDYALSREQNNKSGGKMYIQDKVRFFWGTVYFTVFVTVRRIRYGLMAVLLRFTWCRLFGGRQMQMLAPRCSWRQVVAQIVDTIFNERADVRVLRTCQANRGVMVNSARRAEVSQDRTFRTERSFT